MEPAQRISEEWSSLSGLYTAEEADFMSQLLGNCSDTEQLHGNFNFGIPSALWPGYESTIVSMTGINNSSCYPENAANNTNLLSFLQGCNSTADSSNIFPITSGGNLNDPVTNMGYMPGDLSLVDPSFSPYSVQRNDSQQMNENTDQELGVEVIADKDLQPHKDCEVPFSEPAEGDITSKLEKSRKRSRSSTEVE